MDCLVAYVGNNLQLFVGSTDILSTVATHSSERPRPDVCKEVSARGGGHNDARVSPADATGSEGAFLSNT